ncbi:unnamed protein product [Camellia sinensis]
MKRTRATPTGEPPARWMESGSPVEKMEEMTEPPESEERKWMTRRRTMGRRRRPTGLRSSAMKPVIASPWSPSMVGTTISNTTTTAKRTAYGGPWRSSIMILGECVFVFLLLVGFFSPTLLSLYCVFVFSAFGFWFCEE